MSAIFRQGGPTILVATTVGTSTNVVLPGDGNVLRIFNHTQHVEPVYVRAGVGAQTATATDFPIEGRSTQGLQNLAFMEIDYADDNVAVLGSSVAGGVYITRGWAR